MRNRTEQFKREKAASSPEYSFDPRDAIFQSANDRKRLIALLDTSPSGIVIIEKKDGSISFSNDQALKIFGNKLFKIPMTERPEKLGLLRPDHTPYPPSETPGIRSLNNGETIVGEEMIVRHDDCSESWISVSTSPLMNDNGEIEAVISVFNDITQKKEAENEIAYQAMLINNVTDAIIAENKEFIITFWNKAAEHIYGWKSNEVIGKNGRDILKTTFLNNSREEVLTRSALYGEYEADMIQVDRNGKEIYFHSKFKAIKDSSGKVTDYVIVNRDISDRKKTEEALRESENKFSKIFRNNPVGIVMSRLEDGVIIDVNQNFLDIFGWEKDEIENSSSLAIGMYNDPGERQKMIKKIIQEGGITNYEIASFKKNREPIVISISSEIISLHGRDHLLSAIMDITEKKRSEKTIRESEEAYSTIFRNSPMAIMLTEYPNIRITKVNEAFLQLFGYTEEEILSSPANALDIAYSLDMAELINIFLEKGHVRDYEVIRNDKSGHELFLMVNLDWLKIGDKKYVMATIMDHTRHRKMENAIREREKETAQLASVIELSSQAIAFSSLDGRIIFANAAMQELTGYSQEELKNMEWNKTLTAPEYREHERNLMKGLLETGNPGSYEKEYITKNGFRVPVEIHLNIMKDDDGNPKFWFAFISDITARKKYEESLFRMIRTLKAMQKSSQLIAHVRDEKEYLRNVCRIIVEDCGHTMVWIGYKMDDERKTVIPVASAGSGTDYVDNILLTWDETEYGKGPVGTSIRKSEPVIVRDISIDPNFNPWRSEAEKRGFVSAISLPIYANDITLGTITIYSDKTDSFSDEETELLMKLANDLTYGITAIRLNKTVEKAKDDLEIKVEQRTSLLRKTLGDLDREKQRVTDVLNMIPAYVAVLSNENEIRFFNRIFENEFGEKPKQDFFSLRTRYCGDCTIENILDRKKIHYWELKTADGKYFDVSDYPYTDSDGTPLILEMGVDITEKKNFDKLLIRKILETEEKDRRVFASDLHDDLGPTLSAIKLQLSFLMNEMKDDSQKDLMNICDALLSEGIEKMKYVANSIMPSLIESFGTETAVKSFINRITKTSKIKFNFTSNLDEHRFDTETELHLYRIITELITNTIKHSGASNVNLNLELKDKVFTLTYYDDGKGYDFHSDILTSGIGLQNIQNRTRLIEAESSFREENGKTVFVLRKTVQ